MDPNVKIYLFRLKCDHLRLELCNVAFLDFELLVFVLHSKYFLIHYKVAVYLRMFHVVLVFAFLKLGGGEQPYQYYRSEERRVGNECGCLWSRAHENVELEPG